MKTAMFTVLPLAMAAAVSAHLPQTGGDDRETSGHEATNLPELTYENSEDFDEGSYRGGQHPAYILTGDFTNGKYWEKFETAKAVADADDEILKGFKRGCRSQARKEQPTLLNDQIHWALAQSKHDPNVYAWCFVPYLKNGKPTFRDYTPVLAEKLGYNVTLVDESPKPTNKGPSSKPHD